ncbi:MAG: hypothetical protein KME15_03460 [Drouetiella hepatica Uher 2000/2452]|jgi:hypothetical protein|uniref:Uncharacterized protein n=1 Tax=Drouetiella hepatica Uher 2000/2452 TaxID=904376 RepID=A0A951Q9D4_9CYAN|nr:hypothetical protein [Drouetiella hepatica Uher 2000/2452]
MQVLLVCLVLFFVASELYQWIQGMTLPLPMLIVAGVALAIASNLRSLSVPPWSANPPQVFAQAMPEPVVPNPVASKPSVQLPDFISQTQPVSTVKPVVESGKGE